LSLVVFLGSLVVTALSGSYLLDSLMVIRMELTESRKLWMDFSTEVMSVLTESVALPLSWMVKTTPVRTSLTLLVADSISTGQLSTVYLALAALRMFQLEELVTCPSMFGPLKVSILLSLR